MLAAQYSEYTKDVTSIRLNTVEKPTPSNGEVLIRVHAAAANPVDFMVMQGNFKAMPGWTIPFPSTLGYDLAGVVESDASGTFNSGDRVFAVNWDTPNGDAFAEYALVPASKLSKLPDSVIFEQGAAVALVGPLLIRFSSSVPTSPLDLKY